MAIHNTYEGLCTEAQNRCRRILEQYVAPVATDIVRKHIQKDIYDAYTPKEGAWVSGSTYQRRKELLKTGIADGGLYTSIIAPDEILITSDTHAGKSIVRGYRFVTDYPGAFLEFFEQDNFGVWRKGFPRPAVSNAQKEINRSGAISDAIKRGIEQEF